jgi:hypothetical protein
VKSNRRRNAPIQRKARTGAVVGVAAGLVVLSVAQAGTALAAPKADDAPTKSGDIKVHNVGTGEDDNSNEPKVCAFTLVGDNFDAGESLSYAIILAPPFKDDLVVGGTAVADADGSWSTATLNLADGHYKVTVDDGEDEKHKVFKVECAPVVETPPVVPPVEVPPVEVPPVEVPPAPEAPVDTDGEPVPTPEPNPEVGTEVLPPAVTPAQEVQDVDTVVEYDKTVTGTWVSPSASATLPRTGANAAGIGVAGLLLVGAGLGLRRAARGNAA